MRTIKFRGYAHHQDKWVYGSLLLDGGEAWITETEQGLFVDMNHQIKLEPVIPETVGQFTGLTDKNGKEIYEGDIVDYGLFYYDGSDKWFKGTVEHKYFASWIENNESETDSCYLFQIEDSEMIEVIGNIHDNPELLK